MKEIYGLLGINGAGKTTLMKMMLGIKCLIVSGITISPKNIVRVMLAMGGVFVIIANFAYHVLANGIEKKEV